MEPTNETKGPIMELHDILLALRNLGILVSFFIVLSLGR